MARLENAAILVTDLEINSAESLFPVLQMAYENGHKALAVLARKFSDEAAALLVHASRSGKMAAIGIKTPGTGDSEQYANLQDLTILAGGRAILAVAGDSLEAVQAVDLGRARQIWADAEFFGLVGGKGDPLSVRRHLASLKGALSHAESADLGNESRDKLRARIGRLNGGAARLMVGGTTESEQKYRRTLAERASLVMRAALQDGVLPGGGAALLVCRAALETNGAPNNQAEQAVADKILIKALEQPARTIAANAGFEFEHISQAQKTGEAAGGMGFNALTGQTVDLLAAGILDAAGVQKAALIAAVKGAALALTVDVLVHHTSPRFSAEP